MPPSRSFMSVIPRSPVRAQNGVLCGFLHWWASNHEATNRETVGDLINRFLAIACSVLLAMSVAGCVGKAPIRKARPLAPGRAQGLVKALSRRSYPFRVVPGARLPR